MGFYGAVEQNDLIGIARNIVQIVRHQNDRHIELIFQVGHNRIEQLQTVFVNAGNRLVQNQQIRLGIGGHGEHYALQFAAGQTAEPLVDQRVGVEHAQLVAKLGAQLFALRQKHRAAADERRKQIIYAHRAAFVDAQRLRHITHAQLLLQKPVFTVAVFNGANVRNFAQNGAQQRGFARAVAADNHGELPAVTMNIHIVQQLPPPRKHPEVPELEAVQAARFVRFDHG